TGAKAANFDALMAEARDMVRKGQLFWDYVSAENGVGFHNPAKALDTLASAIQISQRAVDLACQATNFGISPALAQDIKTLVPPILKFSRKMQQDPAVMQSHPWLKMMPVSPPAEKVWDGQKKVGAK
ncbi:MAG: ammonia-forming cytochrome c nitrite reductase subunit c552, partial [Deltaproteobacteria bacterium]|nr:ammonia-forming cytochrome c nitrite reductase subunit c552 [Deltaproteobacteria bacterium]